MAKRVAVIGGGPAGLSDEIEVMVTKYNKTDATPSTGLISARELQREGHQVQVFEQGEMAGYGRQPSAVVRRVSRHEPPLAADLIRHMQ